MQPGSSAWLCVRKQYVLYVKYVKILLLLQISHHGVLVHLDSTQDVCSLLTSTYCKYCNISAILAAASMIFTDLNL